MPPSPYTAEPSPDITLEEYLQRWVRQGFLPAAAIAHLLREVREGYVEFRPLIVDGSHIAWKDGHFFVEIEGVADPVPASKYRCHERTPAERADFLHRRDQQSRGLGVAPAQPSVRIEPAPETTEPQTEVVPEVETVEVVPIAVEVRPKAAPADDRDRKIRQLAKQRGVVLTDNHIQGIRLLWAAMNPDDRPCPEDKTKKTDFVPDMKRLKITKRDYESIVRKFARVLAGLPELGKPGSKGKRR